MTGPGKDTSSGDFDAYAEHYGRALDRGIAVSGESKEFFASHRVHWLQGALDRLRFTPARMLDYGCGTGTATPYLLGLRGAQHVHGVDISAKSIAVARQSFSSNRADFSLNTEYAPDGRCDLAFCNGVFHHIPLDQRAGAVSYILRSLRPGGLFALWENNPWNPGTQWVMARIAFDRHAIKLSPPTARHLVQAAGFGVLDTTFQFIFPAVLGFLRPLEAPLSRLPLGAQYLVLAQKPG